MAASRTSAAPLPLLLRDDALFAPHSLALFGDRLVSSSRNKPLRLGDVVSARVVDDGVGPVALVVLAWSLAAFSDAASASSALCCFPAEPADPVAPLHTLTERARVELRLVAAPGNIEAARAGVRAWAAAIAAAARGSDGSAPAAASEEGQWLRACCASATAAAAEAADADASAPPRVALGSPRGVLAPLYQHLPSSVAAGAAAAAASGAAKRPATATAAPAITSAHSAPLAPLSLSLPPLPAAPRPRLPILVYVCPASGKGRAEPLWREVALPVLTDAGVACEAVVTRRAGQASDELADMPWARLRRFSGVVAVGGDGSLAEVVQGLMRRRDWRRAARRLVVGVVPAGSGNGLSLSLLHDAGSAYSVVNAAMLIARGHAAPLDVASAFVLHVDDGALDASSAGAGAATGMAVAGGAGATGQAKGAAAALPAPSPHPLSLAHAPAHASQPLPLPLRPGKWGQRRYSFLSTEWAIVADIDLGSEHLRCLGDARFDVYGLVRALALRKYRGRFSYLPADRRQCAGGKTWWGTKDEGRTPGEVPPGAGRALSQSQRAALEAEAEADALARAEAGAASPASPTPASGSAASVHDGELTLTGEDHERDHEHGAEAEAAAEAARPLDAPPALHSLLPFDLPPPLSWRVIEGTFTLLWVTNTTHQSVGVAISPAGHHSDSVFSVVLVRDVSAIAMARILLSLDDRGSVVDAPGVQTFTCSAWRLEPEAGDGNLALDGERVPYGPIQAEIHAGLLSVFA